MNHYLKIRQNIYLNQSLVHYGIMVQNNKFNIVKSSTDKSFPYTVIDEGIMFAPILSDKIRNLHNVRVYKNNRIVFEKSVDESIFQDFSDEHVFDLYDVTEKAYVDDIIQFYENNRNIYIHNTEHVICNSVGSIAGLASGMILAKLSYLNNINNVIFYDFSQSSLDFQKELIFSDDRKQTFLKYLDTMTTGYQVASIYDFNNLNFDEINIYYDYLKNVTLEFVQVDLRDDTDIKKLFDILPVNSTLWISNVLHYITTLNHYDVKRYELLDSLAKQKNIKILPHTRVYYESTNNI